MLTDAALKCLKPKAKMYKVTDRDGMYVRVAPTGGISFRLDYRLNGRRETVHLGKYARDGISLARARELCLDAKRMIAGGAVPRHREAAGEAPDQGGQELRRVRREVADGRAHGGQRARHAPRHIRA